MIATQRITSTADKPARFENYEPINVLKWKSSRWKNLCPYLLKTDGNEICSNPGGVLFENFYQGCKVYDVVYENDVYPSKYQKNDNRYLQWSFRPETPSGDVIIDKNGFMNRDLYLRWRDSLWACENPVRYPNKIHRIKKTQFTLCIDKDGNEIRFDYDTSRREIYVKEYIRLVKNLPEYTKLLNKLRDGQNIMLCEIDVPARGKSGLYGEDCDAYDVSIMSISKLEALLNDTSEAFGHGLCLAYSLLLDMNNMCIPF